VLKPKNDKNTRINSNFPQDFLRDFELGEYETPAGFEWVYHKKALDMFHLPITYMETDGHEDHIHYGMKQKVHDYIYETYYLGNECKYYITTELQQKHTPFKALLVENGEEKIYYKLDVCAIRVADNQVFDIEIDGPEHTTQNRMMKDAVRDKLLNFRYGIYTLRIPKFEEINFKKLDKFLKQEAMPYTRKRKIKGIKNIKPYDNTSD
jgi:hypothetical protein